MQSAEEDAETSEEGTESVDGDAEVAEMEEDTEWHRRCRGRFRIHRRTANNALIAERDIESLEGGILLEGGL